MINNDIFSLQESLSSSKIQFQEDQRKEIDRYHKIVQ